METITLETLYQRTVTLEETLTLILELLTKEERKKKELKSECDEISSIPPIPNSIAARLLKMSTRQLQRVRRKYRLTWEERGREVYYHLYEYRVSGELPFIKTGNAKNSKIKYRIIDVIEFFALRNA